jgi:hypothetical protein
MGVRVEESVILPVGCEEAWATLLRWEEQAEWMKDADSVRVLSPMREGVGVELAVKTRLFNVPAFTDRIEVVDWVPPARIVVAHRRFVTGTGTWTLDPTGEGSCRFTWVEDVSIPPPVLGSAASLVYRPFMRKVLRGSLRGLAEHLAR